MVKDMNDVAKEIQNGFNALAGGIHDAGKKRIKDLVAKQGYVAYKNYEAAQMFKKDLDYIDWIYKYEDGEYRFYPPTKDNENKEDFIEIETNKVVEAYKKAKKDYLNTRIVINMVGDNICEYTLLSYDPRTLKEEVIQKEKFKFNGKFSHEILPSLYYHLCDGLPVIDNIKDSSITFISVENDYMMFGNIHEKELEVIYQMKEFVDERLHLNIKER